VRKTPPERLKKNNDLLIRELKSSADEPASADESVQTLRDMIREL